MPTWTLALLLALPHPITQDAAPPAFVNAGFEAEKLEAWSVPPMVRAQGCDARVDAERPFAGARCARVETKGSAQRAGFGNLAQTIVAERLGGRRVRVRAAVRVEGEGRAQLWLRADGKAGFSLLLDN